MNAFYILSGPPGAGKTSLLEKLSEQVSVVGEPARRVLASERKNGGEGTGDQDPVRFVSLMTKMAVSDYLNASGLTVFDRGLPDLLAFSAYYDLPDTEIMRLTKVYHYNHKVFWLPAWAEIYSQDDERTLDFNGAKAFGALTKEQYIKLGYELIEVPKTKVNDRAAFILSRMQA